LCSHGCILARLCWTWVALHDQQAVEPDFVMTLPQHMATVNGMPPLQNGMMHSGQQHPAAQQSQQQQQPGMVPVSALQHDPLGSAGASVFAELLETQR